VRTGDAELERGGVAPQAAQGGLEAWMHNWLGAWMHDWIGAWGHDWRVPQTSARC
jgi:hypothetical protein